MKKLIRRGSAALLAAVMLFTYFMTALPKAYAYPDGYPNTYTNTGDQRTDVVEVAKTQLGYAEDSTGTKYGQWWKDYNNSTYNFTKAAWCAMFVLWCENQANASCAVSGMSASSSGMLKLYQQGKNGNAAYAFGSGYMPRPGDIIFVGYSGNSTYTDHTGLIIAVDDTTITTLEGNYNDKVSQVTYSLSTGLRKNSARAIVAFGVPAYAYDSSASFTGPVVTETTEESIESTDVTAYTTVITGDILNVRALPRSSATVKNTLVQGTEVTITAEATGSDGHLWGKLSDGSGWISLYYTECGDEGHNYVPKPKVLYTGTVSASSLNVHTDGSASATVTGTIKKGTEVSIIEEVTENGTTWGHVLDVGWVSLKYVVKADGTTAETSAAAETSQSSNVITGTVSATSLNVRNSAGNGSVVSAVYSGQTVSILETTTVDGTEWGRISSGWICMKYVKTSGSTQLETTQEAASTSSTAASTASATGTVTASALNVRKSAPDGTVVSTVKKGSTVSILETTTVNGSEWGRIEAGWISMKYVTLDSGSTTASSAETTTNTTAAAETTSTGSSEVKAVDITGTVKADILNVRSEAVTGTIVDRIQNGSSIHVSETVTVNGTVWGRTTNGWVSMDYVTITEEKAVAVTYTVTGTNVNVRAGAGTSYDVQSKVTKGDTVSIDETQDVNGTTWGHITTGGWICMTYAAK